MHPQLSHQLASERARDLRRPAPRAPRLLERLLAGRSR